MLARRSDSQRILSSSIAEKLGFTKYRRSERVSLSFILDSLFFEHRGIVFQYSQSNSTLRLVRNLMTCAKIYVYRCRENEMGE